MKTQDVMVRDILTVKPEMVGILSEADLIARAEDDEHRYPWWIEALIPASKLAQEFAKVHGKKVSEVMSTNVVSASEDTPVSEIAALLERHRIKRLNTDSHKRSGLSSPAFASSIIFLAILSLARLRRSSS